MEFKDLSDEQLKQKIRDFISDKHVICPILCLAYLHKHGFKVKEMDRTKFFIIHGEVDEEFKNKLSKSKYEFYKTREFEI